MTVNMLGTRYKQTLEELSEITTLLEYLYTSPEHSITVDGYTYVMDADTNLFIKPYTVDESGKTVEPKATDDLKYMCVNDSLTVSRMLDMITDLKKSAQWANIKQHAAIVHVLNRQ